MLPGTQGLGLSPLRTSGSPLSHSQEKQKHPHPLGFVGRDSRAAQGVKICLQGLTHPKQAIKQCFILAVCGHHPSCPAGGLLLPPCPRVLCVVVLCWGCACGVGVSHYQNNMQTAAQSPRETAGLWFCCARALPAVGPAALQWGCIAALQKRGQARGRGHELGCGGARGCRQC